MAAWLFVPLTLTTFVVLSQFVELRSEFCCSTNPLKLVGHAISHVLAADAVRESEGAGAKVATRERFTLLVNR